MIRSDINLQSGQAKLNKLISDLRSESEPLDFNEADTRHRILDVLIHECLGWSRNQTKLERRLEDRYSDYELGNPPLVLIEAKRTGTYFSIPPEPTKQSIVRSIKSLCIRSDDFRDAFDQAQSYCATRGIQIGIVTNGLQTIVFVATRNDGKPPKEGRCLLFDGLEQLSAEFRRLWQVATPIAADRNLILEELISETPTGLPSKLSNEIAGYPSYRYPSDSQQSLRTLSDLLIEDAPNTVGYRRRFYEECYCETGALAKDALLGKKIISSRYAAMFRSSESSPTLERVDARKKDAYGLSVGAVAEALGHRPIVLIGDVGVGKTSFIRNLVYVRAAEEFDKAIFLYIDFGIQANLGQDIKEFLLQDIERQLYEDKQIDIQEDSFVRGVYHGELLRFQKGIYSEYKTSKPEAFRDEEIRLLAGLVKNRVAHLKMSIQHLSRGRKKQVIIVLDNADQRSFEDQQAAFLAAQEIAAQWEALVLISLRPSTYFASKTSGAVSGYPQRMLTIAPPRVDLVLEKRLRFSLELAEGRLPIERLEGISLNLDSIALFLKALLFSLKNNREISELLSNITGGNIREALELIKGFIGSANVDSDKIVEIMREDGRYMIPLHEFSKQAILGEYRHFDDKSSIAYNLFDIWYPERTEHFLSLLILGYLLFDNPVKVEEGFLEVDSIINELQRYGFVVEQIRRCLRRLTNKKLIETTERVTFKEGLGSLGGDLPHAFRITTVGVYHVKRWAGTFAYLDAMVFDTPILDETVRNGMRKSKDSLRIDDRYERAVSFRTYLNSGWEELTSHPKYVDWPTIVKAGDETFQSVARARNRRSG